MNRNLTPSSAVRNTSTKVAVQDTNCTMYRVFTRVAAAGEVWKGTSAAVKYNKPMKTRLVRRKIGSLVKLWKQETFNDSPPRPPPHSPRLNILSLHLYQAQTLSTESVATYVTSSMSATISVSGFKKFLLCTLLFKRLSLLDTYKYYKICYLFASMK